MKGKNMIFAAVILGLSSLISQFVLIRELQVSFQGNELSLGIALFLWLSGGAGGSFLANFLLKKRKNLVHLLSNIFFLNAFLFFAGLFLSRSLKLFLSINPYETLQPFAIFSIAGITLLPLSFLFGLSFVVIAAILSNPVKTYYLESAGAFCAGLLSLILIKYLNSSQIMFIAAMFSLTAAFLIRAKNRKPQIIIICALLVCVILFPKNLIESFQQSSASLRFKPQRLLAYLDSIYANIAVTEHGSSYNLYENGKLSLTSEDKQADEEISNMALLSHPAPEKVLLLGGSPAIISEILKHPVKQLDYVQPDAKLIKTVEQYFPIPPLPFGERGRVRGLNGNATPSSPSSPLWGEDETKKIKVINKDCRSFAKSSNESYGIIIINMPGPYSLALNRFYTKEFFISLKKLLNKNGILCVSVNSKEDILALAMLEYNACLYKTAKSVFKYIDIVPGERMILICSSEPEEKYSEDISVRRFLERNIQTDYFTAAHIKEKLSRKQYVTEKLNNELGLVHENSDYRPWGFLYYLKLSAKESMFSFNKLWDFFGMFNLLHLIVLFLVFYFILRKNIIKAYIVTSGFTAIALEIIISLLFAINFGFLYYALGAIIACFMLGLSLGAVSTEEKGSHLFLIEDKNYKNRCDPFSLKHIIYFEILLAFACLAACFILRECRISYFIFSLISGFLCGAEFGLFCKLYKAATVYSLDLAGAAIGSLSITLILIPIFGIYQTCLSLGLIKIIGLCFSKTRDSD